MGAAIPFPRILLRTRGSAAGGEEAATRAVAPPAALAPQIPEAAVRELGVMQVVLGELLVLDGPARHRVLMWVCEQLAIPLDQERH